ncbi:MAG: hypothetical protein ABIT08_06960 [Bacteroidia bacterium]
MEEIKNIKYYVYDDCRLKEVAAEEYEVWRDNGMHKCLFPFYTRLINGIRYSITTTFLGVFEEDEEILPFMLLYTREIKDETLEDKTEFFNDRDVMGKRREELISQIEEGTRN